ncbi:thiamine-phosphate kinase [Chlorobaculum sp. MV4-Y]|uniref:thiamine-phosphate kinase n=1 Tax=Chlorobaculum sp. MV4-Y TaxID=2976335 RepID=UPI0021AFDBB0|nr:thiamine-phosphate kinase [Chlorobaculum sp. MV4-Y]UWX57839.1 thiamine-phosphate kinase [Chlorobaculum sp. MV4-Y]
MSYKPISEIGEFGLIDRLAKITAPSTNQRPELVEGIGDDCAVWQLGESEVQVVTTDLLAEHVHFDLLTTPLHHLGSKVISVNVSDICAMNAMPDYALVSIAVPPKMPVEMVEELYKGINHAAEVYGLVIAGGDTSSSPSGLFISVSMTGTTTLELLTLRKGASPGDLACVTGTLGGSTAGLHLLQREKATMIEQMRNNEPYNKEVMAELQEYAEAIRSHLLPEARIDIIDFFSEKGIVPTAMIDISDGLAADLAHLCRRSGVGAKIDESKLPVLPEARAVAEEFQQDVFDWALTGGEDYQLLFTVPKSQYDLVTSHREITVIGEITEKEEGMMLTDIFGMTIDMADMKRGFDHFAE